MDDCQILGLHNGTLTLQIVANSPQVNFYLDV